VPTPAQLRAFLQGGETLEFTVTGNSMGAALPPGTLVRVTGRAPRLGEWALYDCGDGAAVHRIVWVRGERRYQLGDAEPAGTWITPAELLGTAEQRQLPGRAWAREPVRARALALLRAWVKLLVRKVRGGRAGRESRVASRE